MQRKILLIQELYTTPVSMPYLPENKKPAEAGFLRGSRDHSHSIIIVYKKSIKIIMLWIFGRKVP